MGTGTGLRGFRWCIAAVAPIVLSAGTARAGEAPSASPPYASSSTPAVVEIAPPPPEADAELDELRAAAEAEVAAFVGVKRPVVISVALSQTTDDASVVCSANAMVRDARTGTVLVIVEAEARMSSDPSADQRRAMASFVVGRAVRRVPSALDAR